MNRTFIISGFLIILLVFLSVYILFSSGSNAPLPPDRDIESANNTGFQEENRPGNTSSQQSLPSRNTPLPPSATPVSKERRATPAEQRILEEAITTFNYDEGIEKLEKAMDEGIFSSEMKVEAEYRMAQLLMQAKDFEAALKAYQKFIEAHPEHPMVENAKRAIEYIENYEKYRQMHRKLEEEIR